MSNNPAIMAATASCPSCGLSAFPRASFCHYCGKPLYAKRMGPVATWETQTPGLGLKTRLSNLKDRFAKRSRG